MTQLANANLLDDSVANSSSLKNQRLNRTSQKAVNPNPKPTVAKQEVIEEEDEEFNNYDPTERMERYTSFDKSNSEVSLNNDADDKKIMGMNPYLFWGLVAVGVGVGGYFVYKYIKKGKLPKVEPTANAVTGVTDIKINT